jgi:APA family basic amino acid/polyamine antiporter
MGAAPAAEPARGRLLSILGVGFGVAVIIGNTIAAGIIRTPGEVAAQLPAAWLFLGVWIGGGMLALIGACSMAELGAMTPRSGGQYVFARRALGDYAGFIVGWSDWLSTCGTTAAVAIVIGEYAGRLVPALGGRVVATATAVTVGFAILQWRGVRWGSRTQTVTALLKTVAFVLLVAACFLLGPPAAGAAADAPAAPSLPAGAALFVALIIAFQSVIYTYDGWAGVVYFSGEVKQPGRDIPRALFGGVLAVTAIYALWNLALVYVLPMLEIAGNIFAPGLAAERLFGPWGDTILRSVMILSMLSGINAYHLMASRVIYAMSCDGLFSRRVERVNPGGTPTSALAMSAAVAVAFIWSGTFEEVIAVLAFFFVANYAMSYTSLVVLRRREPEAPRPYRAWGYPWTTIVALVAAVAFLIGAIIGDPRNSRVALLLLALSYPAYRLTRLLTRRGRQA